MSSTPPTLKVDTVPNSAESAANFPPTSTTLDALSLADAQRLIESLQIENDALRYAQQQLEKSRDNFSRLYHTAPVGYLSLNQHGIVIDFNRQLENMLKMPASAIINHPLSSHITPSDIAVSNEFLQNLFDKFPVGTHHHCEVRLQLKETELLFVRLTGVIEIVRSEPICRLVVNDITEHKQLEAQQRLLQAAVEFSTDAISISDPNLPDNPIIYASPKMAELTSYSVDELVGNNWRMLYAKKPDKRAQAILREALSEGREAKVHVKNYRKDGTMYWVEVTMYPLLDSTGKPTHFVAINRDITDRLGTEKELKEAKEQAEAANLAKSQFLADMSHELRTPLNAILGFTQVLMRTNLLEEQVQHLETIHDSGKHLLSLINQVLDMSRIETGHATLSEVKFDLHHLLHRIEEMFDLQAQEKALTFHIQKSANIPRFVFGDDLKLRQILINLLNNAFKFTEKGGVWVNVKAERENKRVKLSFVVEDSGIGIAEDEIPYIFEPFYQKPIGIHKQEGTGLGLTISREFIHLMGGDIVVTKPQIPQGTTFSFCVYVDVVQSADISEFEDVRKVVGLAKDQPNYRLLIVDDDWANRQALIGLMASVGFQVQEASNGDEAVARWQTWQPDLIWMDMRMPVMDGYDATRKIRSLEKTRKTSIIALTAGSLPSEEKWALECGCDDYLRKPISENDLFRVLSEQIGVSFTYDLNEKKVSKGHRTIHKNKAAQIPAGTIDSLCKNLKIGDFESILRDIDAISKYDANFGGHLDALAQLFQYEKIEQLLAKVIHEQSPE